MVKWRGRRGSQNIEDRRGQSPVGGGAGMSGMAFVILRLVFTKFGIGGVVLLVGGFFAMQAVGLNPMALLGGGAPAPRQEAVDDEASQFVSVMLADTEDVWNRIFESAGQRYREPTLVLFSGQVRSACGFASAASGPFYCPGDEKVYLDTSFFRELAQRFGAPGDFAGAYVIAHEVGHHIQTITGTSNEVRRAQSAMGQADQNAVQVRMELQADCYAGLWAQYADRTAGILEAGDIEEGLRAAAAIGDDTLQRNAGRRVTPESFTHGTSEQRVRWFTRGYRAQSLTECDTFSADRL